MEPKKASVTADRAQVADTQPTKDCSATLLEDAANQDPCSTEAADATADTTSTSKAKTKTDGEFNFPGHSHGDDHHDGEHEGWNTAVHGDIKLQLNHQGGPRGSNSIDSVNWLSYDAEREVKGGELSIRGMVSLEPWTTSGGGTRQLFQTGGAYNGQPIIDTQHAHNFVSELSVNYTRPIAENTRLFFGGGIGAPALGPIYFHQHDLTLGTDLSHHFLEGTHNSNGFATVGIQRNKFQLEASAFHGRESDDRRAITIGALDSFSVRAAYAPSENFVMQVSHGRISSPESLEPGDVARTTVSAAHQIKWSDGSLKNLLAWGRNEEQHGPTQAFRAESILRFEDKNTIFGRFERVEKHGLLESSAGSDPPQLTEKAEQIFPIRSFSIGGSRDIVTTDQYKLAVGVDLTLHKIPKELQPVYGSNPVGGRAFLRVTF